MGMRYVAIVFRRLSGSLPTVASLVVCQAMLLYALCTVGWPGNFENTALINLEIEVGRLGVASGQDVAESGYGVEPSDSEAMDRTATARQALEAWDRGDYTQFYEALARSYTARITQSAPHFRASLALERDVARALAALPSGRPYQRTAEVPASLWLVARGKAVWAPLAAIATALFSPADDVRYPEAFDALVWMLPALVAVGVAATFWQRGRLCTAAPVRPFRGMCISVLSTALGAMTVAVLVFAPALVVQVVRAGWGSLAYPVTWGSDASYEMLTVGRVLARNALLGSCAIIVFSAAAHASVSASGSALPGIAFSLMPALALFGIEDTPWLASDSAACMLLTPWAYMSTASVAGSYADPGVAGPVFLGASVANGVAVLAVTSAVLCVAAWFSAVRCARGTPRGKVALLCRPIQPVATKRTVRQGALLEHARHVRGARRIGAAHFHGFTVVHGRLMARTSLVLLVACVACAALLLPYAVPLRMDGGVFDRETYRHAHQTVLSALANSAEGTQMYDDADMLVDALGAVVRSADERELLRGVAAYEELRLELHAQGSDVYDPGFSEEAAKRVVQVSRALERYAATVPGEVIYPVSADMPALLGLSVLSTLIWRPLWLAPAVIFSLRAVRLSFGPGLVGSAPVSRRRRRWTCALCALGYALCSVAVGVSVAAVVVTMLNGAGDPAYPVLVDEGGTWSVTCVSHALLMYGAGFISMSALAVCAITFMADLVVNGGLRGSMLRCRRIGTGGVSHAERP